MSGLLMNCLIDLFPNVFTEDSTTIGGYVQQLLMIIQYIPELRPQIIQLIIEKMLLIDAEIAKENKNRNKNKHKNDTSSNSQNELKLNDTNNDNDDDGDISISDERNEDDSDLSDDDNDGNDDDEEDILSTNLDQLMCLIFDYIKIINEDEDDNNLLNELYQTICRVFESTILSTSGLESVQFIIFYLCSFRTQFAEEFVSRLMRLCTDTKRPTHERCFAAGYIGGYVSKAKYLRHTSAFNTFEVLIQWIAAYIQLYKKRYFFIHFLS